MCCMLPIAFFKVFWIFLFLRFSCCLPVESFSKSSMSLINRDRRSESLTMFFRKVCLVSVGISSTSSIRSSEAARIPVIGVFNSWAMVSKNSSFCLSLVTSASLACFNCDVRFVSSVDFSWSTLLLLRVSLDSSNIFKTSDKLISCSFTTPAINILAEAPPILPVKSFSEKLIKRASAIWVSLWILYFLKNRFNARCVLASPKNLINTFLISAT